MAEANKAGATEPKNANQNPSGHLRRPPPPPLLLVLPRREPDYLRTSWSLNLHRRDARQVPVPALRLLGGLDFDRAILAVYFTHADELARRAGAVHAAGLLPGFNILFRPSCCCLEAVGIELGTAVMVVLRDRRRVGGVVLVFQSQAAPVD